MMCVEIRIFSQGAGDGTGGASDESEETGSSKSIKKICSDRQVREYSSIDSNYATLTFITEWKESERT